MPRGLIRSFVDIVFPKKCLACKNKISGLSLEGLICAGCLGKIKRNFPPFCYSCGRQLEKKSLTKNICPGCIKVKLHFDRAFSPCVYEGVIKELIHEFKYKNKDYLGQALSRQMIDFIKEYDLGMEYLDFVIPIPLHRVKLREREFNQAEILASYIAKEFKKDMLTGLLQRNRPTKTQTDLEIGQRFLNVKESFSVTNGSCLKGKNLLLIDDVLTTGATSSEAAHALKIAGANIVFVLTLAN